MGRDLQGKRAIPVVVVSKSIKWYFGKGNKFYEYPPAQPGSTRTKRLVKYARNGDTYSYATGLSRMPGARFNMHHVDMISLDS